MQRAPPSRVKRHKPYARPMTSPSKLTVHGSFYKARNFTIRDSTLCDSLHHSENFLENFAEKAIPGAAFDSSERDPPPRCHPGTRLAIVERTLRFFTDVGGSNKRLLWLVGPAGVGKSAIMQTLAETSSTPAYTLGASLFFSVNGRDNGSKTMTTLAYQLAVKSDSYRNFIQRESAKDPTLLDKALAAQFKKFILEPFIVQGISPEGHERFLILIDGLDECNSHDTQRTILELISSFCIEYPAAPLVWVIASRPEPHITRFLSRPDVTPSYTTEEIEVDNDESREDVERYLRQRLEMIRTNYPALDPFHRWPAEHDFLKLAFAAGGLFAFGQTVVDYIDDPMYANPASQLQEVLNVIDEIRSRDPGEGKRHPMAGLDVLYSRIISKIPQGTLNDIKMLLLYTISPIKYQAKNYNFEFCCDWLGIPIAAAYGALHHLYSVLKIPSVQHAPSTGLEFRHRSFRDYLADFERSEMFRNLDNEADKLHAKCATRILHGISKDRKNGIDPHKIQTLPPAYYRTQDRQSIALKVVTRSIEDRRLCPGTGILSAISLVDIQFSNDGPYNQQNLTWFASALFDGGVRPELKELNVLQEMSIRTLRMENIPPVWMDIIVSCRSQPPDIPPERWHCGDTNCEGKPGRQHLGEKGWSATLDCCCKARALQRMEARKTCSSGDIVTTFTDVTGDYDWVHHAFPDPEYPSTTWDFVFPYKFKPTVAIVDSA